MLSGAAPPVTAVEFAARLDRLGPFERAPCLALAVSGGADSMVMAVLAADWAKARGGTVQALIVDHGLRAGSAEEAALVASRLPALGIPALVLGGDRIRPTGDIQAAARRLRYDRLNAWCRAEGVLHLLTAHHQDDQAETLLLRLARGSGVSGLSAMPDMVEAGYCRLLRPLLAFPAARLRATAQERGLAYVEDPSNADRHYARVRMRQAAPMLRELGFDTGRLAASAEALGRARLALEHEADRLSAQAIGIDPAGFARLDPTPLAGAATDLVHRVLAALLAVIGGSDYPPRHERLVRLVAALSDPAPKPRTLGGCRIVPWQGRLIVLREAAAIAPDIMLGPGETLWDGRFRIRAETGSLSVGALRLSELAGLRKSLASGATPTRPLPPRLAWPTLPGLRRDGRLVAVPALGWVEPGENAVPEVRFVPNRTLSGSGFTVV